MKNIFNYFLDAGENRTSYYFHNDLIALSLLTYLVKILIWNLIGLKSLSHQLSCFQKFGVESPYDRSLKNSQLAPLSLLLWLK